MTSPLAIQRAMRDQILTVRRPSDNSFVVPRTQLSGSSVIGATGLVLDSLTSLTYAQDLQFADGTAEEKQYIIPSNWDGQNPVPLDFTSTSYSGLQYAHSAGAVVYSNLFAYAPLQLAPGLARGEPVIFVHTRQAPWKARSMPRGASATIMVVLEYLRLLSPPDEDTGVRMHPNRWADYQQAATHEDVQAIALSLLENEQLLGEDTPSLALQMAELDTQGNKLVVSYEPHWEQGDTWHYIATMLAIYAGEISSFTANLP